MITHDGHEPAMLGVNRTRDAEFPRQVSGGVKVPPSPLEEGTHEALPLSENVLDTLANGSL